MMDKCRFKLGGHRGFGGTDNKFYQNVRDVAHLPVENTLASIRAALEAKADYVEVDIVMSSDDIPFIIHNVVPEDHFFDSEVPDAPLHTLSFEEIKHHHNGRIHNGEITLLSDILEYVATNDPKTLPWSICIEIKGVQKGVETADIPYETNNFIKRIAEIVKASSFPIDRILWSSFCLQNVIAISHYFPTSLFGMIMSETEEIQPMYSDHQSEFQYQYLPFEVELVDRILNEWNLKANKATNLSFVHPEIMTITKGKIDEMKNRNLGINTWAFKEILTEERENLYKSLARHAAAQGVPFTVITDYLPEMQKLEF